MNKKVVWLIYDADTAIGINNEGALVFSYNLEDIDHLESGANVYNGQDSVMWVNLREAFFDEIKAMYKQLRSTGALSYAKVEKMFEDHQGKWPEAVFNEDAWFKYLAPLAEKGNATYLTMLQGSKESQRKWWLYNRFKYMDSKYNAGDSLNDFIELRGYAKGDITVTPYADIYASVKYGSYLVQTRAERTKQYTLECPLDDLNDTEIAIYSCSQLSSVGDLSPLKVGRANFSNATRLQEIKLGDASASYSNGNLTELTLGNNALLRKLDVRNCPNLVQAVDISHCTGLEEAYFDGTGIVGLGLPNGGVLKKLHLPGTVANLTIRNQPKITEFVMPSYANITTLRLENVSSAVPITTILGALQASARVRLVGLSMEMASTDEIAAFYDVLDGFRGLDENGGNVDKAQVSGTIHIPEVTGDVLAALKARYPYVTIRADHFTAVVRYWNYDGSTQLDSETVSDGGNGTKINSTARDADAQYTYAPDGWATSPNGNKNANAILAVDADRNVYAAYTKTLRTYTVNFVRAAEDGGGTLFTQHEVPYGTVPTYGGAAPTTTKGASEDFPFDGWMPELTAVDGTNLSYTAKFLLPVEEVEIEDSWDTIIEKITNGTAEYKLGNYKNLSMAGMNPARMQIVGINQSELADGSGYASYDFISRWAFNSSYPYWNGSKSTLGGWQNSQLRSICRTTYYNAIPANVRNAIKEVKKYTRDYDSNGNLVNNNVSVDTIWVPSARELNINGYETEGPCYNKAFYAASKRAFVGGGNVAHTRTSFSTTLPYFLDSSGNRYGNWANSAVIMGFSL